MGGGEIENMNIIAHARAIFGFVIRAENLELRSVSKRSRNREWDEVFFGVVVLADLAVGIGASRIKVAQVHRSKIVGDVVIFQHSLNRELAVSIWVSRVGWVGFVDRHVLRLAENSGGRGENKM